MKRSLIHRTTLLPVVLALAAVVAACSSSANKASSPPSSTAGSAAASTPSSSAPLVKASITVGFAPGSFYTWLVDLASTEGFFDKNGIDAKLVPITGGGPVEFAALANGSLTMAMGDATLGGPLIDKGVALNVVAGASAGSWVLVAPKSESLGGAYPQAMQALKGKGIGVTALGSSAQQYAKLLVSSAGLSDSSVTYQALGATPATQSSAIDANRVGAVATDPATAYLLVNLEHNQAIISTNEIQAGIFGEATSPLTLLPSNSPLRSVANYPSGWEWVTASYAAANPQAVKQIRLALEETDVWMHDPANLQAVAADLIKGGNIPSFITDANVTDAFLQALLPLTVSYVPVKGIDAFQQFWQAAGLLTKSVPVDQWYVPNIPQDAATVAADVKAAQ